MHIFFAHGYLRITWPPDSQVRATKCLFLDVSKSSCEIFIYLLISVADTECLSRIMILSIPDPGSKNSNKREGWKNCCPTFFCVVATNITNLKIILFLNCVEEKNSGIFTKNYGLLIRIRSDPYLFLNIWWHAATFFIYFCPDQVRSRS